MNNRKQQEIDKSIRFYTNLVHCELRISKDLRNKVNLKQYIANIRKLQKLAA